MKIESQMRIIINADDLGVSVKVNDCVFGLMERRRVTSATLMMNGTALEDAVARIGRYRNSSFGVHLNLTEFSPLSAHPGLAPLLDASGRFTRAALTLPLSDAMREGVFAEWCAQIDRARALGVPISHLDSHHHVHTQWGLLGVLRRIQKKFGICKVRIRRNVLGVSHPMRIVRRGRNLAWNTALRHYVCARTTDSFTAFATFHERLEAGLGWKGSIELMCHPGGETFNAETELLAGDWTERLSEDAQLISYNDL